MLVRSCHVAKVAKGAPSVIRPTVVPFTWRSQPGIAQSTVVAQQAAKACVLLFGRRTGQKHAQHGNVLVVLLGLANALRADCLRRQTEPRLHVAGQLIGCHAAAAAAAATQR